MLNWLLEPMYWNWFILGAVLLVVEMTIGGFFFLWPGVAALIVGLIYLVVPGMSLEIALILFAILSLLSAYAWRAYRQKNPLTSPEPALNQRSNQYIGRTFVLGQATQSGVGEITADGAVWRTRGPDLPAGARVKVVGVDGNRLLVEAADTAA
jgi:inner membrane protein